MPARTNGTLLPFTRVLSLVVLPFLVVASLLLYLAPAHTDVHFAWTITPPLTARYLASAYIGGVWFFASVLLARSWDQVRHGFPAVITFAALLGIATILHWDRFHHGHISFVAWATLYVSTPFLVAIALGLESRRRRPRAEPQTSPLDTEIPRGWRIALAAVGFGSLAIGVTLFLVPALGVNFWAWSLTPLTARVLGATLTLPGMVNLWLLFDGRWSAFRILFQAQMISLGFILLAILLSWSELDFTRPAAWFLVPGLAGSLLVYALLYRHCQRRTRLNLPVSGPPVNPRTT